MGQRGMLAVTTILLLGLALPGSDVAAQQKSLKEQLTGAWAIVSTDQTSPDGTKHQLFGPNPKGVLVLDASQHARLRTSESSNQTNLAPLVRLAGLPVAS